MKTKLTPTQAAALQLAARRPDGRLAPLPPNIRGAARDSVIQGLVPSADYEVLLSGAH